MAENYKHQCIKCQAEYSDNDPEPYYCALCNEERKLIARQVDAKFAGTTSTKPPSFLQQYEAVQKEKGVRFVNIRDLGITL